MRLELIADGAFVALLFFFVLRLLLRYVCAQRVLHRRGFRARFFDPDVRILYHYEESFGRDAYWYLLRYAKHGIVLSVAVFGIAFAMTL